MQIINNHFLTHKHRSATQELLLSGPQGPLQGCAANLQKADGANLALILSPNPTHKGTMNNPIVNLMFNIFKAQGFSVLKFNYRGVGESKGTITSPNDTVDDALHVLDWLIEHCENSQVKTPRIFVAGFALGGWTALQCAMRRPEISHFISINSQFYTSEFNMLTPCPSGLMLQATNDQLYSCNDSKEFLQKLIKQKGCSVAHHILEDDHYLRHSSEDIKQILTKYISEHKINMKLQSKKY